MTRRKPVPCAVLFATVLLAVACGDRGPTAPTSSPLSSVQTHLRGVVLDTLGRSVPDVRIDIVDGPHAGNTTNSDARGAYELVGYGIGMVRLRARHDGFETATILAVWQPASSHEQTRFYLKTLTPPLPFTAGTYTLTVASNPSTAVGDSRASCTGFPPELRRRTYDASVSTRTSATGEKSFIVDLTSPTMTKAPGAACLGFNPAFPSVRGCFGFSVAGDFVGFEIENGWGWDWIEEWPGYRYLTISGYAPASDAVTTSDLSTTIPFRGSFEYCELKAPLGGNSYCFQVPTELIVEYRACHSTQDVMVFTER